MKKLYIITLLLMSYVANAKAEEVKATLYLLEEKGQGLEVGTISFEDTDEGLLVKEDFANLPAGSHGIHVHENGDCGTTTSNGKTVLGGRAGGHYDPSHTGKHTGPNADGHKGDLPVLVVASDGTDKSTFYIKGLTASELKGRSVIIHAGGDNYKDTPQPLGGGGDRIACGVIE